MIILVVSSFSLFAPVYGPMDHGYILHNIQQILII